MKNRIINFVAVMAVTASVFAQNSETPQNFALGKEAENTPINTKGTEINRNIQNSLWSRVIEKAFGADNPFPLIILDGKKISREELYKIDDNGGTFTILKGVDATSLYGDEGANGVVVFEAKPETKGTISTKDTETNRNIQNNLWSRVIEKAFGADNPFPLIILDGKKISREELYKISDNGGTFTILKGLDATSLYGEAGVNGVVVFEAKL